MMTANGEVNAPGSMKFPLPELSLVGQHATILPSTPRVLTVGGLCVDQRCNFIWKGSKGETPYFVLADGSVIECEVHGCVPYVCSGVPAMPMIVAMPGEEDEAMPPEDAPVALPLPAPLVDESPPETTVRDLKAEVMSVTHLMTRTPRTPSAPHVSGRRCRGSLVGGRSGSRA